MSFLFAPLSFFEEAPEGHLGFLKSESDGVEGSTLVFEDEVDEAGLAGFALDFQEEIAGGFSKLRRYLTWAYLLQGGVVEFVRQGRVEVAEKLAKMWGVGEQPLDGFVHELVGGEEDGIVVFFHFSIFSKLWTFGKVPKRDFIGNFAFCQGDFREYCQKFREFFPGGEGEERLYLHGVFWYTS